MLLSRHEGMSDDQRRCEMRGLPLAIQNQLAKTVDSWKVQDLPNLSEAARVRWKAEQPAECPGIALGRFGGDKGLSYAVLLVRRGQAAAGFRLLSFAPRDLETPFEMAVVEESADGTARNLFIRRVPIVKFFDAKSRKRFRVSGDDGILLVDAGESEYETDVYFWTAEGYKYQPVDY